MNPQNVVESAHQNGARDFGSVTRIHCKEQRKLRTPAEERELVQELKRNDGQGVEH